MELKFDWSQKGPFWRVEAETKDWPQVVGVAYVMSLETQSKKSQILVMHFEVFDGHKRKGIGTALQKEIEATFDWYKIMTNARNKKVDQFLKKVGYTFSKKEDTYIKYNQKGAKKK